MNPMSSHLRRVCGLTAWFRIPEQGMARFDVLSQASAVAFREEDSNGAQLFFLTSAHVVQPWQWPHYYPQDWISYVKPEHCMYTLETRDDASGEVLQTYQLRVDSLLAHPSRDVAKLSLLEPSDELQLLGLSDGGGSGGDGQPMRPVRLATDQLSRGQPVAVAGHEVVSDDKDEGGEEEGDNGDSREVDLEQQFGSSRSSSSSSSSICVNFHLTPQTFVLLSRVGVTWYTFKQKGPKFRHDWYKGAYFCKIVKFFGHYNRLKRQTLNGRLPPEDSSVFDDSVCVLIVMT